ncbi:uncharacterized protein LOC141656908 [Silene latifolia]|uniref:uncharacterized protein LOC141656908 n=1 Tax=Silene latifolia TaxID=37657 RepID=UPI003D77CAE6
MIISSWNVRGMNGPLKQQEVLGFPSSYKVDCGVIIETHVKKDFSGFIHRKISKKYKLSTNYDMHSGGRLWVLWNPATVQVQVLDSGAQFLHCSLLHITSQQMVMVTFIYAFNRAVERMELWDTLRHLSTGIGLPWVCLGNFNVSLIADERIGCILYDREMQEFRDCLADCALSDHPYTGGVYTWHNKQVNSPKWAKLDRLLLNPTWFLQISSSTALSSGLFSKLRRLNEHLRAIHTTEFSGITKRVAAAKTGLSQRQTLLQADPLNPLLLEEEKTLIASYMKLKTAEMRILAQKAKVQHMQLSDANTKYFYASIAAKKCRNTVGLITDAQGRLCTGHAAVTQAF